MSRSSKTDKSLYNFSTSLLALAVIVLLLLNIAKSEPLVIEDPSNIIFDKSTHTLNITSMTLKQKIAQMVITFGAERHADELQKMVIGGIYLASKPEKSYYNSTIKNFQKNATIPFFVTADLEGCLNPFEKFHYFPTLKEINTTEAAYQVGYNEGALLKELGFNMDFAPVVDLQDNLWRCRSFLGTPQEIADKAEAYILGMQANGIIATSKHYPGKTLIVNDPHIFLVHATISDDDLLPFEQTMQSVSAMMVSHLIVNGSVQSESKPSVVSQRLVSDLRSRFTGLIITDEVRMLGLRGYYQKLDDMYVDLFRAGNDIILNFNTNPSDLYRMITVVEDAVKDGRISESRIDDSVVRILNAKGITVVE